MKYFMLGIHFISFFKKNIFFFVFYSCGYSTDWGGNGETGASHWPTGNQSAHCAPFSNVWSIQSGEFEFPSVLKSNQFIKIWLIDEFCASFSIGIGRPGAN